MPLPIPLRLELHAANNFLRRARADMLVAFFVDFTDADFPQRRRSKSSLLVESWSET